MDCRNQLAKPMSNTSDFLLLAREEKSLRAEILADFLEAEFPKCAERLRVSRFFPDTDIRLPSGELIGLLEGLEGVRDGWFIPSREYLEGPGNESTDSLCGYCVLGSGRTGHPVWAQNVRSTLRFQQAIIRDPGFDSRSLHAFVECPAFREIRALELDGHPTLGCERSFADHGLPGLRALSWRSHQQAFSEGSDPVFVNPFFAKLDRFSLHGTFLSVRMVKDLAESAALMGLTHLGLHTPGPDKERLEVLTGWGGFQGLEAFELSVPCGAGEGWLETLLVRAPKLKHLGLAGNPGTTGSLLRALAGLGKGGLRSLYLSLIPVCDEVMAILVDWAACGALRHLYLDRCQISWKAHRLIGQGLLPHLETFGFHMRRWQPVQAGMVFEGGSSRLIDLDLGATQAIGALLAEWIPPARYPNLMRLRWRALSPRGLSHFIAGAGQLRLVNQRFLD